MLSEDDSRRSKAAFGDSLTAPIKSILPTRAGTKAKGGIQSVIDELAVENHQLSLQ
jgi:hypothetical protein